MTTLNTQPARSVADLTSGVVLATVEIAAPIERVFRALTDPNELRRWWGSPASVGCLSLMRDTVFSSERMSTIEHDVH